MANVKINIAEFNKYISDNKVVVSEENLKNINSIFNEVDIVSENGEKKADGKLTGDEVMNFFSKISGEIRQIVHQYLLKTDKEYAEESSKNNSQQVDRRNIDFKMIPNTKSIEEQQGMEKLLSDAKSVIISNQNLLNLSAEEVKYIENIKFESVNYGAARYDTIDDSIKLNYNLDKKQITLGNMVKVLFHELNHAVVKEHNSQKQEAECETKAIKRANLLYQKGVIPDAIIYGSRQNKHLYKISEFNDAKMLSSFIKLWLDEAGYRGLPEQ